ncbi:MAG: hypothetical protein DRN95_04685 [Candidatus Hydrothermarchaeota archaeon]|nr:MAG: hypothetical protein DRN95_04685 [Candidatus Hydrothermarchaeota archaeon]
MRWRQHKKIEKLIFGKESDIHLLLDGDKTINHKEYRKITHNPYFIVMVSPLLGEKVKYAILHIILDKYYYSLPKKIRKWLDLML